MSTHGAWAGHPFRALDLVGSLGVRELLLEPFDHFLTEVAPLSKFLLDLLVDLNLALVGLYLLFHLVILEDKDLSLLRLVLQLRSQLMILEYGQMSGRLQLLVVHGEKVCLRLLDIEKHLFAQLLSLFYPVQLLLIHLLQPKTFLIIQPLL